MTGYNKLKLAILAIMTTQTVSAITIDPIQIQSGSGDLLYAEMKFSNSNPNEKVEASLADADDIQNVGVSAQAPGHLNFYTRRSGDGSGVIVITSSRPIVDSELNILLKIKEGSATHIQQVKAPLTRGRANIPTPMLNAANNEKPLTPQIIVSEKDIALNLPTSTQYQANTPQTPPTTIAKPVTPSNSNLPLTISVVVPPALKTETHSVLSDQNAQTTVADNSQNKDHENKTASTAATPQTVVQAETQTTKSEAARTQTTKATEEVKPTKPKTPPHKENSTENAKAHKTQDKDAKHVVQANESLWKIASRIALETNQSVPEVMKQIKENNANAFIQGDVNRIRRGAALNLAASYKQTTPTKYKVPATAPTNARKQSGSAKYRLDQAEMSIVADNEQNTAQGSAKKNTQANQTTTELSTKVMTSREKTVKLQKNVTQLAAALQQKNQRIELLNARLAQLQQQLQKQPVKKPKSNS